MAGVKLCAQESISFHLYASRNFSIKLPLNQKEKNNRQGQSTFFKKCFSPLTDITSLEASHQFLLKSGSYRTWNSINFFLFDC
ncbi:hypothetical protein ACFX15_034968 [Malus domestica]